MSFQATRFILGLTDLSSSQKAVAHTLAYHAGKYGENSYPSMDTIARESGLQSRRSAQRIVRQLEKKRIITATTPKTGGRGQDKATVYRLDLDYKSPVNGDTTVALSDQETATPESRFTVEKQRPTGHKSAAPETTNSDIDGHEQRHPGRTNSTEQSRRVSEEVEEDQHQSRVQEPLTHTNNSKAKAHADGRDDEDKLDDQTSIPDHQNQNQSSTPPSSQREDSRRVCVAAAPAYGTEEWWAARNAGMTDEEKVLACISTTELSKNRSFKSNGNLVRIVLAQLAAGVPWRAIADAAQDIANTLDDRDQMPGLTLEKNLVATIDKLAMKKVTEARNRVVEEKRKEEMRLEAMRRNAYEEVTREETVALRERTKWEDQNGRYCDGFVSTNPNALHRAELWAQVDQARFDHSGNYSALRDEATKLRMEAIEARLSLAA